MLLHFSLKDGDDGKLMEISGSVPTDDVEELSDDFYTKPLILAQSKYYF